VETAGYLTEDNTKEAREEDMDKEDEEDKVAVEEDHLPALIVSK
jgi:hypothetical protein